MASRKERRGKKKKALQAEMQTTPTLDTTKAKKESSKENSRKNIFLEFYENKYKQLLIIPFLMLITAFVIIGIQIASTGDFVDKDVTLKGGLTITILAGGMDPEMLEDELNSQFSEGDIQVRALTELGENTGLIIDASDVDQGRIIAYLENKIDNFQDSHSVESIGPALGRNFFTQTMRSVVIAFILMAVVVFLYFRTIIPSMAVVLAAFSDIVITVAIMNVMGMKLSTAGIAALLMLIGYSVDTDILLSTRVLKSEEGSLMQRVISAVKTGLTMNATTLVAIVVALIISQSETINQIMSILLIGLLVDIINTWIQNVGILRLYIEKKKDLEKKRIKEKEPKKIAKKY